MILLISSTLFTGGWNMLYLYLFDWALNIFANLRKASLYKRLRWYFFFYLSALHLAQITPNSISVAEPTVKRKKKNIPDYVYVNHM